MDSINKLLKEYGDKLVRDLKNSLRNRNVKYGNANSDLANSIDYTIKQFSYGPRVNIKMNKYGKFVDRGRGPGPVSKEGVKNIIKWANRKKITERFAKEKKMPLKRAEKSIGFLIARKIRKDGYKANYFYTDIINDGRQEELARKIALTYKQIIKSNINNYLEDKWQSQ